MREHQLDTLIKREKIFDNIIVPSGTKKEAIKIISRLCATHRLLDESTLEEAFWKREEWDSTGCGDGIAIPPCTCKGNEQSTACSNTISLSDRMGCF